MRTFCFLETESYHRRARKAAFNKRKPSSGASNVITTRRTNPACLIICLGNGRSLKPSANFRIVTP